MRFSLFYFLDYATNLVFAIASLAMRAMTVRGSLVLGVRRSLGLLMERIYLTVTLNVVVEATAIIAQEYVAVMMDTPARTAERCNA